MTSHDKIKVVILTPVDRYLGFSAPISPVQQFTDAATTIDVSVTFKDPQRIYIVANKESVPTLRDKDGDIDGDVFFAFGHTLLDRNMVKYAIIALEKSGKMVINGSRALTVSDDKGLMALEFAGKLNITTPKSVIASARSASQRLISEIDSDIALSKMTGYTAGGVGIQPLIPDMNQVAPALWASRMDEKPRVLQNDIDGSAADVPRTVIRAYIVGGVVIGCYTTNGYGIVNCAGLARESKAERFQPNRDEIAMLLEAAHTVGASGYCRIDAVRQAHGLAIFEVNPLARIDTGSLGIDVAGEILRYAKKIGIKAKNNG